MRAWENALGDRFIRVDISRALAETADLLRASYVEWTDSLGDRYGKDSDWWFTHLAERNPLASPLFLHACYVYLLKKISSGKMERPHLIVVESWGLLRAVRMALMVEGWSCCIVNSWKIVKEYVRRTLALLYAWVWFCVEVGRGYLAAARTREGTPKLPNSRPHKPIVIIDTFVHEDSLSDDHIFRDRYFPFLHEWLERQGWEVWVLPTLYGIQRPLTDFVRSLRRSETNFIIREDWLAVRDILSALFCSMKALWYPRAVPPLLTLDMTCLVGEERWRQGSSVGTMQAKLISRLPGRLAAAGFQPALVIDWFENQKIDKALAIGIREAFPGTRIVGVQCFIPLLNYLVCFPTRAEWASGATPDRIVCSGLHQAKVIKIFKPDLPVEIGAALRFQYLHDRSRQMSHSGDGDSEVVLITLPSRNMETAELLHLVIPVIKDHPEVKHWFVKPHPDHLMSRTSLEKIYGDGVWSDQLKEWVGTMSDALAAADVVISTGSGTLVEAASLGIPVIVVGRQTGLTFDPMAWFEGAAPVCYSSSEISSRLREVLCLNEREKKRLCEWGERLREECYERLSSESLKPYVAGLRPIPSYGVCEKL